MHLDKENSQKKSNDFALALDRKNVGVSSYLFRSSKYRRNLTQFKLDLEVEGNEENTNMAEEASMLPPFTEVEFLQKYKMSRESFGKLLDKI